jgi:hypothetical protein
MVERAEPIVGYVGDLRDELHIELDTLMNDIVGELHANIDKLIEEDFFEKPDFRYFKDHPDTFIKVLVTSWMETKQYKLRSIFSPVTYKIARNKVKRVLGWVKNE